MKLNHYQRHILYQQVWEDPMSEVAACYGISDVMLKKVCKQLDVPTPPRGYWAKVAAGKTMSIPGLPETKGPTCMSGYGLEEWEIEAKANYESSESESVFCQIDPKLASLVYDTASKIEFKKGVRLRPSLQSAKRDIVCQAKIRRVNSPFSYDFCDEVSESQKGRVFAIAETVARAVEELGGRLVEPFAFQVLGEQVDLEFYESSVKEPHTNTKSEIAALKEYEESRLKWGKPNIRKWDYRFSGELKVKLVPGRQFRDEIWLREANKRLSERGGARLEELLPTLVISMCEVCARERVYRTNLDAKAKAYVEQAKTRQVKVKAYNEEAARLEETIREAELYDLACILRKYSKAIEERGSEGDAAYAEWVAKKADWADPLVNADDSVLGVRNDNNVPPAALEMPTLDLPYEFRWEYDRIGERPNATWGNLVAILEKQ